MSVTRLSALLGCCLLACAAPFTLAVTSQLIEALDGGKMKLVRRNNSWCPKQINIALLGVDVKLDILQCFVHESVELKKVEQKEESAFNALSARVSTMNFLLNMHASDVDNLRFMTCTNTTELTKKTTELAENITELGKKIDGLREELTEKTTGLAENITELGKNMELNIDGLRETLSAKIDDLQFKLFFGMLAIAVYVKVDTDAKFGRLLFAFMLMCAHAFRYAKMFNNAMGFIHLGRCYPPRCPGAAPHSAPARWRYLSRTPVAGLPVTPMASL